MLCFTIGLDWFLCVRTSAISVGLSTRHKRQVRERATQIWVRRRMAKRVSEKEAKQENEEFYSRFSSWIVISLLLFGVCMWNKHWFWCALFFSSSCLFLSFQICFFCFFGLIILNGVCVSCDEIKSNEMRFNKQELATLATQPSNKFEKEGILYVTERQDGFFRRSEGKHCMQFNQTHHFPTKGFWISN